MKNAPWIIALVCVTTLAGHVIIGQQNRIQKLQMATELSDKARTIDQDQIRDLLYAVNQLKTEKESLATQYFVSGAVSVLEDKERFQGIWHDGYDRGAEVQLATYAIEKRQRDNAAVDKIRTELNLKSPLEGEEKK